MLYYRREGMLLLCFEDQKGEIIEDYRVEDQQKLINALSLQKVTVDMMHIKREEQDNESIWTLYDNLNLKEHLSYAHNNAIHLSAFTLDLWLLFRCLEVLVQSLRTFEVHLIIVEDLIYVPRPYIFDSKQIKFFRRLHGLETAYDNIKVSILSSQQLRNKWAEGDTYILKVPKLLSFDEDILWNRLHQEIPFNQMMNQGNPVPRLISIQSIANENGRPIYRHPNDAEPPNIEMVPLVREILSMVEEAAGIVGLNHVLIQHYRDGRDTIAVHSDKTLDIDLQTPILNVSVGNTRMMYLQNKANKQRLEKLPLQHGECVMFGLQSNQYWWHEIPKDVTLPSHPIFDTGRVSFTFRRIATFYHERLGILIGQGSPYKTLYDLPPQLLQAQSGAIAEAVSVAGGEGLARERDRMELIQAFSNENKQHVEFDWERNYGEGFLLHSQ